MSEEDVDRLLEIPPFQNMNAGAFSPRLPLRGILKNDCRIQRYIPGDIVIRQGDYGNSAFLILEGTALVALAPLSRDIAPREKRSGRKWLEVLARSWKRPRVAEARVRISPAASNVARRGSGTDTRVFVQDIPGTIGLGQTLPLEKGQLFGELAALTRTPRSATVIADSDCTVLEMRWQGFRDLMRRDAALREHVEALYRRHSLGGHLRLTPVLGELPDGVLEQVAAETVFETWGEFEWYRNFRPTERQDEGRNIEAEPVIASEGGPVDSLVLIRNGFARLSRRHGSGHQSIAYLGKGRTFGLRELAHNWRTGEARPWSLSLRAVGYVDVLRIPRDAIERLVLPNVKESSLPPLLPRVASTGWTGRTSSPSAEPQAERRAAPRDRDLETGLLEFLVDQRLINGTQAMLIDLDRCTRCDDCVRACAAMHDNNPRFLRSGPRFDHWMFASACMHCVDPVCMIGCPTGAISRDETTGNVVIEDLTCIGCGTCAASCPYENIRMVDVRDPAGRPIVDAEGGKQVQKATKCDLCNGLPGGPACQRACPHDALVRIDLTTPLPLYQLTCGGNGPG
jgi:Fe-S-cluster-containing dehydrogenase component/CRP-like cAMP-binding protein